MFWRIMGCHKNIVVNQIQRHNCNKKGFNGNPQLKFNALAFIGIMLWGKIVGYDIYLINNKQIAHVTYVNKQWFPGNEKQFILKSLLGC